MLSRHNGNDIHIVELGQSCKYIYLFINAYLLESISFMIVRHCLMLPFVFIKAHRLGAGIHQGHDCWDYGCG